MYFIFKKIIGGLSVGALTVGFIGIILAIQERQEIVNTPCAETHGSLTPDEDKSEFYHGNIFIYVRDGCNCKSTLTKASIDLATKGSIEQLHNMDQMLGRYIITMVTVGTAEEPGEYYEGNTFTPQSDYKWTVSPNIDQ